VQKFPNPAGYTHPCRCRVRVSRHRNTYKSFETLCTALVRLPVKNAILDGENVCLDSEGQSQFKELLYRRGRAVFYAFDGLQAEVERSTTPQTGFRIGGKDGET
jgi:hypothetical protein